MATADYDPNSAEKLAERQSEMGAATSPGTSAREISGAMSDAMKQARRDLPNEPEGSEKVKLRAAEYMVGYLKRIAPMYAAKEVGDKAGKALGKVYSDIQANQNQIAKDQNEQMKNAYGSLLGLENTTAKNFVDLWQSTQRDGIEVMKQPYQMQASMGSFLSGLGVIVSMFPQYADIGREMVKRGTEISLTAGKEILNLEKSVALMPHAKLEQVKFTKGYSTQDSDAALNRTANALDPQFLLDQVNQGYGALGGFGSGAARVRGGGNFTLLPLGQDATFDRAHAIVAQFEGGYANNPKDRGGPTLYGIASTKNPAAYERVKALYDKGDTSGANELARGFYHKNFWQPVVKPGMSSIEALVTYDTAVNMGPDTAKEIHAKAKGNPREMLRLRQERYNAIIAKDPSQAEFQNGWSNRLQALKAYADRYDKETNPEFAKAETDKPAVKVAEASPSKTATADAQAETAKLLAKSKSGAQAVEKAATSAKQAAPAKATPAASPAGAAKSGAKSASADGLVDLSEHYAAVAHDVTEPKVATGGGDRAMAQKAAALSMDGDVTGAKQKPALTLASIQPLPALELNRG